MFFLKITKINEEKDSILNQIYKIELVYEKELLKKKKLQLDIKKLNEKIQKKLNNEKE